MEEQAIRSNAEQMEQEPPNEERQPWEQPKLERLHVSLDTAGSPGTGGDAQSGSQPS